MSNFSPNFDVAALAIESVLPNNKVLYDDKGLPSVMVWVPKATYKQLGLGDSTDVFPAFIVNGVEVDGIYISKYQNVVYNGRAYSLPGKDPRTNINLDTSIASCAAKGAGWHLMTRMEWMAIALWCKKHDCMPLGNNNYGKDASEDEYHAIPSTGRDKDGKLQRMATGTGPLTWSHDRTLAGIWDLNGNVWEWVGGLRTVYGEIQVLMNNNAADSNNPQTAASTLWKAIDATTGELIDPDGSGTTPNSVKMDFVSNHCQLSTTITTKEDKYRGCSFESVTCDSTIGDAAKLLLQALGFFKYDNTAGAYNGDYFTFNNGAAERAFLCGGAWACGAGAGVFFLSGDHSRSASYGNVGFRSAFVKLPTV